MSTIRKIIPFSLYDIPGLEQWLEGQANQGLFPTHLGSWATFEDRGVPGTRFRLDPFANRAGEGLEPTQEKLELYRQAGWESVSYTHLMEMRSSILMPVFSNRRAI